MYWSGTSNASYRMNGGGGGGLTYKNNISVTPGDNYTVVVGAGGSRGAYSSGSTGGATSSFSGTSANLQATGGNPGRYNSSVSGGIGTGGDSNRTGGSSLGLGASGYGPAGGGGAANAAGGTSNHLGTGGTGGGVTLGSDDVVISAVGVEVSASLKSFASAVSIWLKAGASADGLLALWIVSSPINISWRRMCASYTVSA